LFTKLKRIHYKLLALVILLLPAACTNLMQPSECDNCNELRKEHSRLQYQMRTSTVREPNPTEIAQLKKLIARDQYKIREVDAKLRRSGQGYSKYVDDEGNPVEIKSTPDGFLERTIYYKNGQVSKARIPRLSPRELFDEKQKYRESLVLNESKLQAIDQRGSQSDAQQAALSKLAARLEQCRARYCRAAPITRPQPAPKPQSSPTGQDSFPVKKRPEGSPLGDSDLRASANQSTNPGIFGSAVTDGSRFREPAQQMQEVAVTPGGATLEPPKMRVAEAPEKATMPEVSSDSPRLAPAIQPAPVKQLQPKTPAPQVVANSSDFKGWLESQGVYIGEGNCSAQFTRLVSNGQLDIALSPLGDDVFKGQNGTVNFNVDPSDKRFAIHYASNLVLNAKKGWRCMLVGRSATEFQMECERQADASSAPLRCEQVFTRTDNF
jgi:ribosomal protein L29